MMRFLLRLLVIVLCLGLGGIALGQKLERWLIYPFDSTRVAPADVALPTVTAQTLEHDGERLVVWTARPAPGQPVILYLHGNAGNLATRAGRFRRFLARGYGLVAPAYRGSSGSTGTPQEEVLISDARHVLSRLDTLLDTPTAPLLLYGESLGGAVALALASTDDAPRPPAGVILEAPFTSLAALSEAHYPGTYALATKLDNQWDSLSRAARLHAPLLILHGTDDSLIPIEMGQQLYAAAPSRGKDFLAVNGAGHTDLWRSDTLPRLWRFIDQLSLR